MVINTTDSKLEQRAIDKHATIFNNKGKMRTNYFKRLLYAL